MYAWFLTQAVYSGKFGGLIHPHHMLYGALSFGFYKTILALGAQTSVIVSLQLLDTLFAFFALILFQVFCFKLVRDRFISIVATLLLGFSFGFWYLAIEPRVNLPHTFFLLLGVYILWVWTTPETRVAWPVRASVFGALGALAILGHLTGGLLLMPLGWGALWHLRKKPEASLSEKVRSGLFPVMLLTAVVIFLTMLPLFVGYRIHPLSHSRSFIEWVMVEAKAGVGLGSPGNYWSLSLSSLAYGLSGFYKTILAVAEYRYARFPSSGPFGAVALAGCIAGLLFYIVLLPTLIRKDARTHILLLLAFVPLAIFSLIWDPINFHLKTGLLPFFWLAVAVSVKEMLEKTGLSRYKIAVKGIMILVVFSLFVYNYFSSIRPGSDPSANINLQRAYLVRDNTPVNAVIYIAGISDGYNIGKIYLVFFAGRQTRVMDWILVQGKERFPESIASTLDADRGRPVYVLSELIVPGPALNQLANIHHIPPQDIINTFKAHNPVMVAAMPDGFALYRLSY